MNTTGNRIRELRLKNDLTLDDVARHLGVGRQAIYKYEQGTVTNIPLENLEKMAELFCVTPGYLAGWTDDHPDDPVNQYVPITIEARSMAKGIDTMPEARRKAFMDFLISMAPDIFGEGKENDET